MTFFGLAMNRSPLLRSFEIRLNSHLLIVASGLFLFATLWTQQTFTRGQAPLVVLFWLLALCCFLASCGALDREHADSKPYVLEWTHRDTVTVVLLFLIALFLRTTWLDRFPLAMHNDEAALSIDAVKVLDGRITSPFTLGWYAHPTLWAYLNAGVLNVTGVTLTGARLLASVLGSLTVVTTYLLGRILYTRETALVAAFLLATYHFHIHFSRIGMNNVADPLFGTLVIATLAMGIRTNRRLYFGATGVLAGLALYFYMGARLFVPLTIALGGSWLVLHPRLLRNWRYPANWYPALLFVAGLIFAAGPLLYEFATWPFGFMLRFQREGLTPDKLMLLTAQYDGSLVRLLWTHLLDAGGFFIWSIDQRFDFYDRQRPLLWGLAAGLAALGMIIASTRLRRWSYHVPIIWFVLTVIFGGVLMDYPVKTPRFITLAPVVCYFIAFAIIYLEELLLMLRLGNAQVTRVAMMSLVLVIAVTSLRGYFVEYRSRESYGNWSSEAATMLSYALAERTDVEEFWLLGNSRVTYAGFPIFWYLAPHAQGHDVRQTLTSVTHVPHDRTVPAILYAAVPERADELRLVEDVVPGGNWQSVIWPVTGEEVFVIYEVISQPSR